MICQDGSYNLNVKQQAHAKKIRKREVKEEKRGSPTDCHAMLQ